MSRLLLAAVVGLLSTVTAWADIGPPKGFKRVSLEHKITTEKEYPEYLFFAISGGDKADALKLEPKKAATIIAGGGRYRFAQLVAVPRDAAKKYDTEKDFLAAVAKGKVEGLLRAKTGFAAFTEVKDSDERKVVVMEYKIDKVDPKEGIVFVSDKKEPAAPPKPSSSPPEDSDEAGNDAVSASTPRGSMWIAGLAATLGVVFAGLWLASRGRRPD